jgi:hypothetical protein
VKSYTSLTGGVGCSDGLKVHVEGDSVLNFGNREVRQRVSTYYGCGCLLEILRKRVCGASKMQVVRLHLLRSNCKRLRPQICRYGVLDYRELFAELAGHGGVALSDSGGVVRDQAEEYVVVTDVDVRVVVCCFGQDGDLIDELHRFEKVLEGPFANQFSVFEIPAGVGF